MNCISIYDSLLKRNKNDLAFKRTFAGDEKWTVHNNVK